MSDFVVQTFCLYTSNLSETIIELNAPSLCVTSWARYIYQFYEFNYILLCLVILLLLLATYRLLCGTWSLHLLTFGVTDFLDLFLICFDLLSDYFLDSIVNCCFTLYLTLSFLLFFFSSFLLFFFVKSVTASFSSVWLLVMLILELVLILLMPCWRCCASLIVFLTDIFLMLFFTDCLGGVTIDDADVLIVLLLFLLFVVLPPLLLVVLFFAVGDVTNFIASIFVFCITFS